ncbi:hypothetical protein IKG16_02740 [Candidatus Saccharibacteria bacterium]|nr:hypothetical protein [Candidatus Saccharibacteria bacterium]
MAKNKNDKRYIRSKIGMEENYLREIRKQGGLVGVKVKTICKGAKVHGTTFFRHYRNLAGIVKDVRNEVNIEYNNMIRRIIRHGGSFYDVAYETFKFIEQHKDYFETAIAINNTIMLEKVGKKIWKCARKTKYRYGMRRIEKVYIYEIIGVLISWMEDEKFNPEKIDQYVAYIVKISSGGLSRLSLLADKD